MRVLVAIPCYEHIARGCTISLAQMMFRLGGAVMPGLETIAIKWTSSSNLPESRHRLAVFGVTGDYTHILWIDSDMEFPSDGLERLAAHDLDIVGANYARRNPPHYSAASDLNGHAFDPGMTGLTKAGITGFGFLLTKKCVFEGEYEMPLFSHHDEIGYVTEDVPFSRKVRARGHDIWIDHDLSKDVRHVGIKSYGADDIEKMPVEHRPRRL